MKMVGGYNKISRRNFIIGGSLALLSYLYFETHHITVKRYTFSIPNLPSNFEGFTIMQLSDLHNKEYGEQQKDLLDLINKQSYDLVAITGDLVNKLNPKLKPGLDLVKGLGNKPIYFVPGNHEWWSGYQIREQLLKLGVRILENKAHKLTINGQYLWLLGVDDPYLERDNLKLALTEVGDDRVPKILLAHAPEIYENAVRNEIDLVLVGHTHGGQVRLPLIGAVVVPGQGLFPSLDYGIFKKAKTTMVITAGLGESVLPIRFNMAPEIVLIKLVGDVSGRPAARIGR